MRGLQADAARGTGRTRSGANQTSAGQSGAGQIADGQSSGGLSSGGLIKSRRLPGWLVVMVPFLAELIVGGYRIAGPSLWRDEAATISGSQRPVGAILALTRNQDAVHGPYYLLMHAVIAIGGISETALRLPSLVAMSIAAGLTAALGLRLAEATELPSPPVVGLLAGLGLTAVPLTTRYAQEARPYALTTLFAVLATYLFVRAAASGRWPWWAGYAAALALTGLFNMFAVLIAVAHGISLVAARRAARSAATSTAPLVPPASTGPLVPPVPTAPLVPPASTGPLVPPVPTASPAPRVRSGAAPVGPADGSVAGGAIGRWLAACAAAAVVLAPLAYFSVSQSAQLNWVTTPDASTLATLIRDFSGATPLIPVVALLGWLGCVAGRGVRRGGGVTLAVVALPWLVVPPVVLLAASFVQPVYVERYVVFCIPALSLLVAAGLIWLVKLARQAADQRGMQGRSTRLLAGAPSALLAVIVVAALLGPQLQIRLSSARADNLREVAAVVAAHERPGDAVMYLPWDTAIVGMAYPAPFSRLRNIELGVSPTASATLRGLPAAQSVVAARLSGVTRVWTVQWAQPLPSASPAQTDLFAAGAVTRMRLIHRWRIASVVLSLFSAR